MSTARATEAPSIRRVAQEPARRSRPRPTRPSLRVVPRQQRRGLVGTVVALTVLALFASLFGLAVFHTMLVEGQSTIDELDDRMTVAEAETERLRLQISELESPERILSVATEDLGMIPPDDVIQLTAESDG